MNAKDLMVRYGINSRQTLLDRFKKGLRIDPPKDTKGRIFTPPDVVEQLDDLHEWLTEKGGTLDNFTPVQTVQPVADTLQDVQPKLDSTGEIVQPLLDIQQEAQLDPDTVQPSPDTPQAAMMVLLANAIANQPQPDPLFNLERLERAAEKRWILSTGQVKALTGHKPTGEAFSYGSFLFTRCGRVGREIGWSVEKMNF